MNNVQPHRSPKGNTPALLTTPAQRSHLWHYYRKRNIFAPRCTSMHCLCTAMRQQITAVEPHLMRAPLAGSGPSPSLVSQYCSPLGEVMKSHVAAAAAEPAGSTVRLLTAPAAASRDSTASRLLLLLELPAGVDADDACTLTAGVQRCCLTGLGEQTAPCACGRHKNMSDACALG